jgi:hypothetical protein
MNRQPDFHAAEAFSLLDSGPLDSGKLEIYPLASVRIL